MVKPYHIAVVKSEFNHAITNQLLEGTLSKLMQLGIDEKHIKVLSVPGAIEIPLLAKRFAQTKKYHAIICLGVVIRGETTHYDYVCQQVSEGCQSVMLQYDIPVIFGVLTTENVEQAYDRVGGKHGQKGFDAAEAALKMIKTLEML